MNQRTAGMNQERLMEYLWAQIDVWEASILSIYQILTRVTNILKLV